MKDYKISLFNEKELFKTYKSNVTDKIKGDKELLENHLTLFSSVKVASSLNKVIFDIYNLEISEFILLTTCEDFVSLSILEDEISNDPNEPAGNYDDIYVTDEGVLYSGKNLLFDMPEKIRKGFIYKKYNKDYSIIFDKNKEELYLFLYDIGLDIIGISGNLYHSFEEDEEPDGDIYTNYLVKYSVTDKEHFIKKSIVYLEKEINERIKGPTIEKLKDNLFQEILNLDDKYGTEGKNIYLKNVDEDILVLLHIEGKINIKVYSGKEEYDVDILSRLEINEKQQQSVLVLEKEDKDNNIEATEFKGRKLVYNQRILQGKHGETIELRGYQNKLCQLMFSNEKQREYNGLTVEETLYGKEQNGDKLKSLVKQVNLKGEEIGYKENILSYKDECVIRNIEIYL